MRKEEGRMKVLVIGPSDTKSRGGMATVIHDIRRSRVLNESFEIDVHDSYIDGNLVTRLCFSAYGYLKFLTKYRKYDLFHIHTASYGSTFRKMMYFNRVKKAGKKAVIHIHSGQYIDFYEGLSEKKKQKVREFLNRADMVIALSDEWKETFEKHFGLTNCVSLPNGIDTEEYAKAIRSNEEFCHSFVMLGRLGKRKGTEDLVRAVEIAVRTNPDLTVYLAGDGEVEHFREMVSRKKLEKNIKILGWTDQAGKMELLKKCSTLVLPSYHEGLPMAILEAMAAGKAIISTTAGAIPELVKPENGVIITPGDVSALAEAILLCSEDTEMLNRMSEVNVRKIEEEYSLNTMHRKLKQYYEDAYQ